FLMPLHRLDRETSGVMIFAKSNAGKQLSSQFRDHLIDRRYLAVVDGVVDDDQGVIETPLEKGDFGGGRKARPGTGEGSRPAKSRYRVVERYADATLVDIEVKTGRTHQIRVHMAELGHPLIGDKVYGGSSRFKRHALHAHTLNFRHPATHKKIALRSPLPQDMAALVEDLRHGQ
ncbi:MAG: RluA family pseudouridine synthase, partial [Deltaproteobacteria bacterium]|nr:RluA family pseudouridine synthase [Deltaproteobacteria bacterium]